MRLPSPVEEAWVNHVSRFHVSSGALKEYKGSCGALGDWVDYVSGQIDEQITHVQDDIKKYGEVCLSAKTIIRITLKDI
jgi:hypothetical protein